MFNSNNITSSFITATWNGCPACELLFDIFFLLRRPIFFAKYDFIHLLQTEYAPAVQIPCPSLPGRPLVCVKASESCPSVCPSGFRACGLKRLGGQLVTDSSGLPQPECVESRSSSFACDLTDVRPLSANFTGGDGKSGWAPVRLNGTSSDGSKFLMIAEIGSEVYAQGPSFSTGNQDQIVQVVLIVLLIIRFLFDFWAVRRECRCRLSCSVSLLLTFCVFSSIDFCRYGPFASEVQRGRLLSSVISVIPSAPIKSVLLSGTLFSIFVLC